LRKVQHYTTNEDTAMINTNAKSKATQLYYTVLTLHDEEIIEDSTFQRLTELAWALHGTAEQNDRLQEHLAEMEKQLANNEENEDKTDKAGLFGKYLVAKRDGTPLDPEAKYFVVRYDAKAAHGDIGRTTLAYYASAIESEMPELAVELRNAINKQTELAQYIPS
jgi:hypothetical protein